MAYSTQTLKAIGAKARISYELFHLNTVARTWIIALDIKRQPHPYRGSRAGRAVFGRIHIRITNRPQNKDEIPCIKPSNNLLYVTMSKAKHVNISLAHIKAHSVKNKIASLQHYLCDSQIDICAITETWIKQDDPLQASDIPPSGYSIYLYLDQMVDKEGVALAHKTELSVKNCTSRINRNNVQDQLTMECMYTHIKFKKNIDLYRIYRYPNTSMLNFIECLSKIIEGNILNDHGELVLIGDFNIHIDSPEVLDTILFNDFLDLLNLKNLVDFSTHLSNHIIDLIITDKNSSLISHPRRGHMLSDHHFILADLQNIIQPPPIKTIKYRKLKSISSSNLEADLSSIDLSGNTLNEHIESSNSNLVKILDSHAPQKECRL